jgi:hypothetical protein
MHLSFLSFSLCSLCVACIYCLPMQVVKGLDGDGPVCLLKIIVKFVVSMKTKDLVPPLTNA